MVLGVLVCLEGDLVIEDLDQTHHRRVGDVLHNLVPDATRLLVGLFGTHVHVYDVVIDVLRKDLVKRNLRVHTVRPSSKFKLSNRVAILSAARKPVNWRCPVGP